MFRSQLREAREEGFTLIELLIVIVVLGILAGIVVFGVGTFRADAQTSACKADVKTVQVAADAYNAKNGVMPTVMSDLTPGTLATGGAWIKTIPLTGMAYTAATGWDSTAPC